MTQSHDPKAPDFACLGCESGKSCFECSGTARVIVDQDVIDCPCVTCAARASTKSHPKTPAPNFRVTPREVHAEQMLNGNWRVDDGDIIEIFRPDVFHGRFQPILNYPTHCGTCGTGLWGDCGHNNPVSNKRSTGPFLI